jgi:hypothetical protein
VRWSAYPELAYTKDSMTVDLRWRPAHQPDLFPPSEILIAEAQMVSHGDIAFPTLNTTHALWLEAHKMLQDRNFTLSNPFTISLLSDSQGPKATPTTRHLAPLVSLAQAFTRQLFGNDSTSASHTPKTRREAILHKLHQHH